MSWLLLIADRAWKRVGRFPRADRERIEKALGEFEHDPYAGDIEKISGEKSAWRRRVGNYRILYDVSTEDHKVNVSDIDRRTSSTY